MMKTNPIFSYANLSGLAAAMCQAVLFLLYITVREIHPDQDMLQLAVAGPLLSLSLMGASLILLWQAGTGSVKAVLSLNEILIAMLINGIVWFCLFYGLFSMGLGLVILNPFLGWLSTLQDGLVLVALFAGFSAYVALLASLALVFPFLFSVSFKAISTFELK